MAEDQRCTLSPVRVGRLFSKASGAPVISAGFRVLPGGGQGFGRSLPFGSCVLLEVGQVGSLKGIVEVRSSPGMKGTPLRAVRCPRCHPKGRTAGMASAQGQQEKSLEPSPQYRG